MLLELMTLRQKPLMI